MARRRFGFGYWLGVAKLALGGGSPPGPTLNALTVGPATLTNLMSPGDVVASISGKTADSDVILTGAAFDAGRLDISSDGGSVIVGTAGPGFGGTTTGTYSLVEFLDGASNSPRTSGPFSSITTTQDWHAIDNGASAYSRSANANLTGGATRDQYLMAEMFRLDALPAAARTLFGHLSSNGTSVAPRLRVNPDGGIVFQAISSSYNCDVGLAEVGRWYLAICQMNTTNGHGTGTTDRARGTLNGVRERGISLGAASVIFADRYHGYETATGTTVAEHRRAFAWIKSGSTADFGKIDFDSPLLQEAFDIYGGFDPINGIVELPLIGGGTVTLTPDGYFKGSLSQRQTTGEPNLGNMGAGLLMSRAAGAYTETDFGEEFITVPLTAHATQSKFTANDGSSLTFASPVTGMQDAVGNWIIANPTGVAFADAPLSTVGVRTISGGGSTASLAFHGMMLNSGNTADSNAYPGSSTSPYEGSLQGMDGWGPQFAPNREYEANLNVSKGRTGVDLTLTSGTLHKQTSKTSNVPSNGDGTADRVSMFTIIDGTLPTAGTLVASPPAALTAKTWFEPLANADIDLSGFPNLSAVSGAPSFFQVYNQLRYIHHTGHLNQNRSAAIVASFQESNYGRDYASVVGDAALLMCLASTTTAQKQAFARCIIHHAVQYVGMYEAGRTSDTGGLGATSQGRKLLLALASILTGTARFTTASQAIDWMPEQWQIIQIDSALTSRATDPYDISRLGLGEWSSSRKTQAGYPISAWTGAGVQYRHVWATTMFKHYVALKVITGLSAAANWADFESYMAYYYDRELGLGFTGDGTYTLSKPQAVFGKNFRETHTSYFP